MTQKQLSPQSLPSAMAVMSLVLMNVIVASALPHQQPLDLENATPKDKAKDLTSSTPNEVMNGVVDCPTGQYYNEVAVACRPCSPCPINQIIRRPCSGRTDTLCGPFFEFDKFHQSPVRKSEVESHGVGGNAKGLQSDTSGTAATDLKSSVSVDQAAQWQWRTLAFALITVLSVICCIVVIVGLYVCIMCRRSQNEKHFIREPVLLGPHADMDSEPRYVETPVTSRDRIRSSRHLPVYQQIFTRGDLSELFPTLGSSAYDVKTDVVVTQVDEGERHCVYINTAAMDVRDS